MMMVFQWFCVDTIASRRGITALIVALTSCFAGPVTGWGAENYDRASIREARFGDGARIEMIRKARTLKARIAEVIVGQDAAAQILQDRLVQYLEEFGTRRKDPIAYHSIGLPGIGKSDKVDQLSELGFRVIRAEAQQFLTGSPEVSSNIRSLIRSTEDALRSGPTILLIDEVDKLAEIVERDGRLVEESNPFIGGFLNPLMTDGKIPRSGYSDTVLSNVFLVTTMNISSREVERFIQEVLKKPKNYYDLTVEDFSKFDRWIRSAPSAVPRVLSGLFRSNTVSRMAPNTVIDRPLSEADYRQVIQRRLATAIAQRTGGAQAGKMLAVEGYSDGFVDFLMKRVVTPALGARDTVLKTDTLIAQLLSFAVWAPVGDEQSMTRPRRIKFDVDPTGQRVTLKLESMAWKRGQLVPIATAELPVEYDQSARSFIAPPVLAARAPAPIARKDPREKPLTKKQIVEFRFPRQQQSFAGLAEYINSYLHGQEDLAGLLEEELASFVSTEPLEAQAPPFVALAGFPGIGKSAIVLLASEFTELPIVRMNMQAFTSSDPRTVMSFADSLKEKIREAKSRSGSGKYILLIEELDKLYERDPATGAFVDRPVIAVIKDLLDKSRAEVRGESDNREIDIRGLGFPIVTMNFVGDLFGFKADPRLTTIDDVMKAWRRISSRPADRKQVLGKIFGPDTVSRLFDRLHVVRPLSEDSYRLVIASNIDNASVARLTDENGVYVSQIQLETTVEYRRFLFNETVIPSEGARNTANATQRIVLRDLERAIRSIPRTSKLASAPIVIQLHFQHGRSRVVANAWLQGSSPSTKELLFVEDVALTFPPLAASGRLPWSRMLTSVHEFGHAFTAVRLGHRFEYVTVVPPETGTGGYVKFVQNVPTAKQLLARIYSSVASRAMERMFLAPDPQARNSVMNITRGASADILQATQDLFSLIYELGFDPDTGTIERMGVEGGARYANFADLPAEKVDALGKVLQDMEDYVLRDLTAAHPNDWYREKILALARAGGLTEAEFYKLIEYPHPGEGAEPVGEVSRLQGVFQDVLVKSPRSLVRAREFSQGRTGTTAQQNLDAATSEYLRVLRSRLHGGDSVRESCKSALEPVRSSRETHFRRARTARE